MQLVRADQVFVGVRRGKAVPLDNSAVDRIVPILKMSERHVDLGLAQIAQPGNRR